MSNRDPNIHGNSHTLLMYHSKPLNPTASSYAPEQPQNNTPSQVRLHPSPGLEARVFQLEQGHSSLREGLDSLTELYRDLCSSIDRLRKGGQPVTVGLFQEQDPTRSHQSALAFQQELEELSREVRTSVDDVADMEKVNDMATLKTNSSVPPHLRAASSTTSGASSKSIPPHLHGKNTNGVQERPTVAPPNTRLATDGPVDNITRATLLAFEPSPPVSPATSLQQDIPIDKLSLGIWRPHFLTTLSPLSAAIQIPSADKMVTFHPHFLEDTLCGSDWSPGLRFVVKAGNTCILKNRTYYLLNPATEPYLPEQPGQHGAKLTAFFNKSPEEVIPNLDEDLNTYENVPMFVEQNGRYVYFGNYSQTRWSDKLDYDTMVTRVPEHVKEFWATELTSPIRQEWVTQELKKHFFRKPEYEGRVFPTADDATVCSQDEIKQNEQMTRDVSKYVEELGAWEREANMKTALIKKQFILDAFDAADADDPPALRLWWEYLECVDWRKDFYDLLVQLQLREDRFMK